MKRGLGVTVLEAAQQRIAETFDSFERVYLSFSAGKDSTVMLHMVGEEARRRGRRFGLLLIDMEAQYALTIRHALAMFDEYADVVEPYWLALPMHLRNAVSMISPRWMAWDPAAEALWVRRPPPIAITTANVAARLPCWAGPMEFEELVEVFHEWYGQGSPAACFVGIRTQESLNRYRTIASDTVGRHNGRCWTSGKRGGFNIYPIFDWRTEDIWTYHAKTGHPYNQLYDRMHHAGLTVHQMRICQPYGDDQRKGLWLYSVIEPETWGRVVARVAGANSGALYAQESGNIMGRLKITKPDHLTWRQFCKLLLDSMPTERAEHYRNKIAVWCKWWEKHHGIAVDDIPDTAETEQEARATAPSWRRVAKVLLRNDYWCKGLHFSQTKSTEHAKYVRRMAELRAKWGNDV